MRLHHHEDHFTCDFCSRRHFPEPNADGVRVLGEAAGLHCPLCSNDLVHAAVGGARVLHCPGCRGLLIPTEDFLLVLVHLRARGGSTPLAPRAISPRELERKLVCAYCHRPMDTHPYAGPGNIVIDNCRRCRVNWLDHGELRRVASAPDPQYTAHE